MTQKRYLMLLRHGKAVNSSGMRDFERPLTARGRDDVPLIAECAREAEHLPELVLCSPASRTRETAELFCETLESTVDIAFIDTLYLASAEEILDNVAATPPDVCRLMVVGHNMGMEDLGMELAGKKFPHDSLPKGALAVFEIEGEDWSRVERANSSLVGFYRPKALRRKTRPRKAKTATK